MYQKIYVLSKNKKNIRIFHLKIIIFIAVKYCRILHGHVCVMTLAYFSVTNLLWQRKIVRLNAAQICQNESNGSIIHVIHDVNYTQQKRNATRRSNQLSERSQGMDHFRLSFFKGMSVTTALHIFRNKG